MYIDVAADLPGKIKFNLILCASNLISMKQLRFPFNKKIFFLSFFYFFTNIFAAPDSTNGPCEYFTLLCALPVKIIKQKSEFIKLCIKVYVVKCFILLLCLTVVAFYDFFSVFFCFVYFLVYFCWGKNHKNFATKINIFFHICVDFRCFFALSFCIPIYC